MLEFGVLWRVTVAGAAHVAAAALVSGAAGCDPCPVRPVEVAGAGHFYDEVWAETRHNLNVWVSPERLPFDLLLDAMDSVDAEFTCFPEEVQRGYSDYMCYMLKLPWDVCWREAVDHIDDTYVEGFTPMHIAWLADVPEDRCDCSNFELLY